MLKKHAPSGNRSDGFVSILQRTRATRNSPLPSLPPMRRGFPGWPVQYSLLARHAEYAGQKNKKALISLLSPCKQPRRKALYQKTGRLRRCVSSLACLQRMPTVSSGRPLLRQAAFWCGFRTGGKSVQTSRGCHHGEKKQSRLGLDTMLDFKVELASARSS